MKEIRAMLANMVVMALTGDTRGLVAQYDVLGQLIEPLRQAVAVGGPGSPSEPTIAADRPRVSEGALYVGDQRIILDSAAWFDWLAGPGASFSYPLFDARAGYITGYMTIRAEQKQRGTKYWVAYRRDSGRLQKKYLGRSDRVTAATLAALAALWLAGA